ncbi:MAG: phosphate acyltransferase PlsX [Candidatus Hydrogenedentes bacterium]|nr:phosphate acyltransferase PlsX [Candidatus Hydrogenedentota bacterium]
MRIAVDAMGSDNAPDVEIEGAVAASLDSDVEIVLVGDENILREKLAEHGKHGSISIVHASEAITMHDSPGQAIRQKRDSSLLVGMRLVKNGDADAIVSAGNTGAVHVAARMVLGPMRGVSRSAICGTFPTTTGRVLLLDIGANVDCNERHLCEFAEMGYAYSRYALGVEKPRVGLLNIGEESAKGSHVAKVVHRNLTAAPHINFIGNIEPKAMFNGDADVVVCDGFNGNLLLKTAEAVARLTGNLLREEFEGSSMNKIAAMIARKSLLAIKAKVDPNESPGAPLLGVNGIAIIIHGSSNSTGVANAIRGAQVAFENKLNFHIAEGIEELRSVEREMKDEMDFAETPNP